MTRIVFSVCVKHTCKKDFGIIKPLSACHSHLTRYLDVIVSYDGPDFWWQLGRFLFVDTF